MTLSCERLTGVDEAPFHTGLAAWPLPIDKLATLRGIGSE